MSIHTMPDYCLAVCLDKPDQSHCYTVYFINNSPFVVKNLRYSTGGSATFDEIVVTTSIYSRTFGDVAPYSHIEIETNDDEDFEFSISYDFDFEIEQTPVTRNFMIGKRLRGGYRFFGPMPYLNMPGRMFK